MLSRKIYLLMNLECSETSLWHLLNSRLFWILNYVIEYEQILTNKANACKCITNSHWKKLNLYHVFGQNRIKHQALFSIHLILHLKKMKVYETVSFKHFRILCILFNYITSVACSRKLYSCQKLPSFFKSLIALFLFLQNILLWTCVGLYIQ